MVRSIGFPVLPPPLNIDLRSLAAFRICFGLYLLWDIYSRLSLGSLDLAWYTSGEPTSILDSDDTPHRSPLHRFWFFRGGSHVQAFLFAATAFLAVLYTIGHPQCPKPLLWLFLVGQQCRNMHVHDGSDNFSRQLLLWSCFLPMDAVWSWKSLVRPTRTAVVVSNLPMYGFCTLIVLMYLGTVCHRTVDLYGWKNLRHSEWLPPQLTAVHYALSGSFAARDNAINRFIQQHAIVSQTMTLIAMMAETLAPIGCVFGQELGLRQSCALLLVGLHFGLLLSLRLPHWQLLMMLTHATVWIPTSFWNNLFPESRKVAKPAVAHYKNRSSIGSKALQTFLFTYMMFNFAGERKWISNIGEALRLSQYWVMYSKVDHVAHFATVTFNKDKTIPIGNFPARWERALHQWASDQDKVRVRRFLAALCRGWQYHPNNAVVVREIRWDVSQHLILPPNSSQRFDDRSKNSSVIVQCEPATFAS